MTYLAQFQNVYHVDEIQSGIYQKGNKSWLDLKYHHSLNVLSLGDVLIQNEPSLSCLSDEKKQIIRFALLLHDVGRAFEKDEHGKTIPFFLHGAEGMHYLKSEFLIEDIAILAAVMVHDRLDFDFLTLPEEDLKTHSLFQQISKSAQKSVIELNQKFHLLSDSEKSFVISTCYLVKDADTLSNIQIFQKLLSLSTASQRAKVSTNVLRSIRARSYVDYSDIQTLPDQGLTYFGWMFRFYYNATRKFVFEENFPFLIKDHIIQELEKNTQNQKAEILEVSSFYDEAISLLKSNTSFTYLS